MADNKKTPAALPDEVAALDPAQRLGVAKELRKVADTFAGGARRSAHCPHSRAVGPLARSELMDADPVPQVCLPSTPAWSLVGWVPSVVIRCLQGECRQCGSGGRSLVGVPEVERPLSGITRVAESV